MSVYLLGDVHGDWKCMSHTLNKKQLTENDTVIVLGDFGFWSAGDIRRLECYFDAAKYSVYFVDGNHENFDFDDTLPITFDRKLNCRVRRYTKNVAHILRGEIFTLEEKTFFAFGGGKSIDYLYRVKGTSWWPQEIPSQEEFEYGLDQLSTHDNKVDYILTHDAPSFVIDTLHGEKGSILSRYFQTLYDTIEFDKWFCGHFHYRIDLDRVSVLDMLVPKGKKSDWIYKII